MADSEKYLFGAAPGAGVRVYRESVVAQRLLLLILIENRSFLVKNGPGIRGLLRKCYCPETFVITFKRKSKFFGEKWSQDPGFTEKVLLPRDFCY